MNGLSASGLADLAGTTTPEVQRLVELGILVARDGTDPFLDTDVQKVRLAAGCEQAGLPMEAIAAAIRRAGCRSPSWRPRRSGAGRGRTYRQVSQDAGVPLDTIGAVLERWGSPGWPVHRLSLISARSAARESASLDRRPAP
jgi:ribosomal protein S6E (S10)